MRTLALLTPSCIHLRQISFLAIFLALVVFMPTAALAVPPLSPAFISCNPPEPCAYENYTIAWGAVANADYYELTVFVN
ncbi:MAG: hypothetical protein R3D98_14795, partial [Candidatus Krumholzibacteriia bacterium]